MDGNGRWAARRGLPRLEGHRVGVEAVRGALKGSADIGVKFLTIFAFSTENWMRPEGEITGLMKLMVEMINRETDKLHKEGVKIVTMGDLSGIPSDVSDAFEQAVRNTAGNEKITLNVAINYGGRDEIAEAAKILAQKVESGSIYVNDINADAISKHLYRNDLPDPDLMIRTSGEKRISNFMLWQIAYSELIFLDTLWPDFTRTDLFKSIIEYQGRKRRFGKVNDE